MRSGGYCRNSLMKPWARAVFPAPYGPLSSMASPGCASLAREDPRARVSASDLRSTRWRMRDSRAGAGGQAPESQNSTVTSSVARMAHRWKPSHDIDDFSKGTMGDRHYRQPRQGGIHLPTRPGLGARYQPNSPKSRLPPVPGSRPNDPASPGPGIGSASQLIEVIKEIRRQLESQQVQINKLSRNKNSQQNQLQDDNDRNEIVQLNIEVNILKDQTKSLKARVKDLEEQMSVLLSSKDQSDASLNEDELNALDVITRSAKVRAAKQDLQRRRDELDEQIQADQDYRAFMAEVKKASQEQRAKKEADEKEAQDEAAAGEKETAGDVDDESTAAATKLSSTYRGKKVRQELKEQDEAATKVAAVVRGRAARKETKQDSAPEEKQDTPAAEGDDAHAVEDTPADEAPDAEEAPDVDERQGHAAILSGEREEDVVLP